MSLYAVGLSMCLAMTNGAANLNLDAHPGDVEGVVHDRYTARVNQGTAEKEKEKETETQQQPMNPSRVQAVFVNHGVRDAHIFWLNPKNEQIKMHTLKGGGEKWSVETFHGHNWLVKSDEQEAETFTMDQKLGATVEVDIRKKKMKGTTVGGAPRSNRNELLYSEAEKREIIKEFESVELMRSTWYNDIAESLDWSKSRPDTLDGVRRAADAEWCGGAASEWLGAAKDLRDGPDNVIPAGGVPGYHVLCVTRGIATNAAAADADTDPNKRTRGRNHGIADQDKGNYTIEAARFGQSGAPLYATRFKGPAAAATPRRDAEQQAEKEREPERKQWRAWRKQVERVTMLFKRDKLLAPSGIDAAADRGRGFQKAWLQEEQQGFRSTTSKGGASPVWPDRWIPQKWKMFDVRGHWVQTTAGLADDLHYTASATNPSQEHAVFLVFEGGQFVWPGIEIGFQRANVEVGDGRSLTMTTKSIQPLIFIFDDFLNELECSSAIDESKEHMKSSGLSMNDADVAKGSTNDQYRTSTTHWLSSNYEQRPWLESVDNRVANITRSTWGTRSQEPVQVLRYNEGQYYNSHLDWTDRPFYAKSKESMMVSNGGYKNRMATVFWYLSNVNVSDGGSTHFPRAGGLSHPRDNLGCEPDRGVHVQPKRGRGMMFYNLLPDGWGDKYSMHTACPIKNNAQKWAANKWVRNEPFRD